MTIEDVQGRAQGVERCGDDNSSVVGESVVFDVPVSYQQAKRWFIEEHGGGGKQDNRIAALKLFGVIDQVLLKKAIKAVVVRHDALRGNLIEKDEKIHQRIYCEREFDCLFIDLADGHNGELKTLDQIISDERHHSFDLSAEPLTRMRLLRISSEEHVFLLCCHQAICDEQSLDIFLRELRALYSSYSQNKPCPLADLPVPYADYTHQQNARLSGKQLQQGLAFWMARLTDIPPVHSLPMDYPRSHEQGFSSAVHQRFLNQTQTQALRQLSQSCNTSLFTILQTAFALLLCRYGNTKSIVLGTPTIGRCHPDARDLIGPFSNSLVLHSHLYPREGFNQLLARNANMVQQAVAHQDIPFELLLEEIGLERSLNHNPLFQIFLALRGGEQETTESTTPRFERLLLQDDSIENDLELSITERHDELWLAWKYNNNLFAATSIERLASCYQVLLDGIVADPTRAVEDFPLLTQDALTQLRTWNATELRIPAAAGAHELFERQAELWPDKVAVVCGESKISYAALNRLSNQIAHCLLAHGIRTEQRVGVCLPRGPSLVAALLGVMKSGAAYVPLDPEYPLERLRYMLSDAGANWLLSNVDVAAAKDLETAELGVLNLSAAMLSEYNADNPGVVIDEDQLAYVLYTSGSTGRPKGVAIRHQAVVALLAWSRHEFDEELLDGVLASTSICFDLSVYELFAPLSVGGRVILARNALSLLDFEHWDEVRLVNTVPSAIDALVSTRKLPATVRVVNLAGEALSRQTVDKVLAQGSVERLYNLYGPSEDTTYSTGCRVDLDVTEHPPIGRPIANGCVYLLDECQNQVPVGVTGELYIGGAGLARGYLGRAGLTAARFAPNPFSPTPGARMYRTGDLARYRPDGEIEYLGRIDHQVKLRGFRIELGEIESKLREQAGIESALVRVLDGELGQQLVGYAIVSNNVNEESLKNALRQSLPEYMVPAVILLLESFPLTSNGKVDRQRLPAPDWSQYRQAYEAPRDSTEQQLAEIYQELLGIDQVGVRDNFFKLGGHSLLAMRLISRIRQTLDVELPMHVLFEHASVAGLALELSSYRDEKVLPTITAVAHDGNPSLSYAQQRLWFVDKLEDGSSQYNLPYAFRLTGKINVQALKRSLEEIVQRHEVLRAGFIQNDQQVIQYIRHEFELNIEQRDLSAISEEQQAVQVQQLVEMEARGAFDLSVDLMLRAQLIRLSDSEYILTVTIHHIAADGWSARVMFHELSLLYAAYNNGAEAALSELPIQYSDYAHWQRDWLQDEIKKEQLDYWQSQLAGIDEVHGLPLDYPRPAQQQHYGVIHTQQLTGAVSTQLIELCAKHDVTLFMLLHTAFAILLSRYSNKLDIVTGTTISGRQQVETEPLIGYFVNTVVLRTQFDNNDNFIAVLKRNKKTILEAFAYQYLPFEMLVEALRPERSLSHSPIIQIMFTMLDDEGEELTLPNLAVQEISRQDNTLNFDLRLSVRQKGEDISLEWVYSPGIFNQQTIGRMANNLACLLDGITSKPDHAVKNIPYIDEKEKHQLLVEWNQPSRGISTSGRIHDVFEVQARLTPDAIAVVCAGEQLSYSALNEQANHLAHYLIEQGVKPDTLVGLCVTPSVQMVLGILGIIKAGGAYVPLDPSNPRQRLAYILDDAEVKIVLTQSDLIGKLPAPDRLLLSLDQPGIQQQLGQYSNTNPQLTRSVLTSHNLLYVIYTSGSTGLPKGVLVEHGNLCHFQAVFARQLHYLGVADNAPWLWSSASAFDASFKGILALNKGRRVIIATQDQRADASSLANVLLLHKIPVFNAMPQLVEPVLDYVQSNSDAGVNLIIGGDEIGAELWRKVTAYCQQRQCRAINAYGPTELTINATYAPIEDGYDKNIGKPVVNSVAYVLDEDRNLLPIGVPGELYVGGNGVARGYCRRKALTAERFIPDLFERKHEDDEKTGARLYRTGDRVRRRADGGFDFLGRMDDQVKLRGFRIELGEIESLIKQQPGVVQAHVLIRSSQLGEKQLAAYVMFDVHDASDAFEPLEPIKQALKQSLPDYMTPGAWFTVVEMPLTATGKLDKNALLALELEQLDADQGAQPRTATEKKLCEVWRSTLELEQISIDANFFDLGGHSLLAMKLINQIREEMGAELDLQDVFEHPSVASMAEILRTDSEPKLPSIEIADRSGPLPLSFVQQRLRFIDQLEGSSSQYNVPWAFRVAGPFDRSAMVNAINAIIQRHEVLRTCFVENEHEFYQVIQHDYAEPVKYVDLSSLEEEQQAHWLQKLVTLDARHTFDLNKDVLLRAQIVKLAIDQHALLFNMHHIVTDAWSAGIFFHELHVLYTAYSHGQEHSLPPLRIQYADYAQWQRDWTQGEFLTEQLAYWKKQLAGIPALHGLPLDKTRPEHQSFKGKTHYLMLDHAASARVYDFVQAHNVTLFMLMQTAFAVLLGRYSRETDITIGAPIAGRTHNDTEALIGCFVNTLALRTRLEGNPAFIQVLEDSKQTILDAFSHQHIPFEMLVETLGVERNLSYSPIFQIAFATEKDQQAKLELPSLQLSVIEQEHSILKFDLELVVIEKDGGLLLKWDYNTDLFEAASIEQLARSYAVLLEGLLEHPRCGIEQLPLMREPERQQLLEEYSGRDAWQTTSERQPLSNIVERFAAHVAEQPNALAVSIAGESLSYRALNEQANRLAHYLRSQGVTLETLVGICLPLRVANTHAYSVVVPLAIIKAGGVYVPLSDLSLSQQQEALTSLNIKLVVGTQELSASLAAQVVALDAADMAEQLSICSTEDTLISPHAGHHLACALYLVEEQRGIAIEQKSLLGLLDDPAYPAIESGQLTAAIGTDGHDLNSFILWQSLCNGGQYIRCDSPPDDYSGMNHVLLSGDALSSLAAETPHALANVPHVIVSSPVDGESIGAILAQGAPGEVLSITGPEGVNGHMRWQHIKQINRRGIYPIALSQQLAREQDYTSIYLLDRHLQPVPVGAIGEVYHGGMRLNSSAEEVIASPFHQGEQLRKTCDWARWVNADAGVHLERIERIDGAVLIRGKRVSPAAVREQLKAHAQVTDAWVTTQLDDQGQRRLAAYVIMSPCDTDHESRIQGLHKSLQGKLSTYELPSVYVFGESLPYTQEGEVDESQLPDANVHGIEIDTYIAPRNAQEETLCSIWQSLLGVDRIGIEDDFFLLGGHSLLATRLISRIRQDLSVELPLRVLFEFPTVRLLATALESHREELILPAIEVVDRQQPLSVSFAQGRLWFIDRLEGGSSHYNMPFHFRLKGILDTTALWRAIQALVDRHEVLRTRFVQDGAEVYQIIRAHVELPIVEQDLTALSKQEQAVAVQRQSDAEARCLFDLDHGLLLRARLLRLSADEHVLLLNMHHIASDGWSMEIFFRELSELYAAYRNGQEASLPPLPVQYADYAHWQREWLQGDVLRQQLDYWQQQLADSPPVHELPFDHARPEQQSFAGRTYRELLDSRLVAGLNQLCQSHDVTLFMLLQTAFAVLVGRFSHTRDVVMGTPIAGRTHSDTEPMIGFFVNMLALRTRFNDADSFAQLLARNKQTILDAFGHQHIPFEMLVELLQPERSMQHSPLFQILFALHNSGDSGFELSHLQTSRIRPAENVAKFDLELFITEQDDGLLASWNYNTDLFESASIEQLAHSYAVLLESLLEHPELGLEQLPLVRAPQRQQLLEDYSRRDAWQAVNERQQISSIAERFAAQVAQQADAMALSIAGEDLTYQTLNEQANRLAHYLRSQGVTLETRVALCLPPSIANVVAQLAIVKAGGAYVPLSAFSSTQQQEALAALNIGFVLGDEALSTSLPARVITLDSASTAEQLSACSTEDPLLSAHAGYHLACVFYVAEEQRGIEIEHMSLLGLLDDPACPAIKAGQIILAIGADADDFNRFMIWQALCNGGQYQHSDSAPSDCAGMNTVLLSSEALLSIATEQPDALSNVAHVIVGSAVDAEPLSTILAQGAPGEVFSVSGPEGVNGHVRWQRIKHINRRGIYPIALSRRLAREQDYTSIYLLDRHLQPVPVGALGEVYHGGMRLSDDTGELIASPFHQGESLRKTGAWARWVNTQSGAQLVRVERIEGAVLIRGKRVSPAAVCEQLKAQIQVSDAWVTSQLNDEGQRRLVAYVVMAPSASDNERQLRTLQSSLQGDLSAYELPSVYVLVGSLPLTENDDVDEEQLPNANEHGIEIDAYIAPRNAREELLCAIWQSLLGVERIGIEDDFFLLGGHSLLATRLISRIRQDMNVELPLRVLFECPTVHALAEALETYREEIVLPPITTVGRGQPLAVSFAQGRLWFIDRLEGGSSVYNMPFHFRLKGALDTAAFWRAVQAIVDRHEVLRTRFVQDGADVYQVICARAEVPIVEQDLTALNEQEQAEEVRQQSRDDAQRLFDLKQGLLLRAKLLRLSAHEHVVLLNMHHIASDGWSMEIFFRELRELYDASRKGEKAVLPSLPMQYADYAHWQREWLQGDVLRQQLDYWKQQLADSPPVHGFPLDHSRPRQQDFRGKTYHQYLDAALGENIKAFCQDNNVTLYMFLQTAYAVLISRYSNAVDIVMGTPVAGRLHKDVEPMIGFFINMLTLRNDLSGEPDFHELLARNRNMILDAFAHQHIPFEMLVEELNPQRNLSHSPLFQLAFAMPTHEQMNVALNDIDYEPLKLQEVPSKFDIGLSVIEEGDRLRVNWVYCGVLFEHQTIQRLSANYVTLLQSLMARPDQAISEINLLADAEKHCLLNDWQPPSAEYPSRSCVHELFEQQVARTPDAIALVVEERQLSYRALNEKANRLAAYLVEQGVKPDTMIGLFSNPSAEMVIGILGIMKAGGAYVPLDPAQPEQRLAYMLDDSGVDIVLTQQNLESRLPLTGQASVCLDCQKVWAMLAQYSVDNVPPARLGLTPDNLIYAIYTSGSTGQPKGVLVEHNSVCHFQNVFLQQLRDLEVGINGGWLWTASYAFDASVKSLLSLSFGRRLVLATKAQRTDATQIAELLLANKIDVFNGMPQLVEHVLEARHKHTDEAINPILSGDQVSPALWGKIAEYCRKHRCKAINAYGPTELTINASYALIDQASSPHIGQPVTNSRAYILDQRQQLLPIGAIGELYVSGCGLARGYLNQPRLQDDKFIRASFQDDDHRDGDCTQVEHGARLYRTGDRVRWLHNGQLEFLGRIDRQVKIHGFRIELGDIEAQILRHAEVRQVHVLVRTSASGEKQLAAYLVTRGHKGDDVIAQVRDALHQQLPEYMLPVVWMALDTLPQLANGKVDLEALLQLAAERHQSDESAAPRTPVEEQLCAVWQETLQVDRVGLHDNFFELGGFSLLAIKLLNLIREQLGAELDLQDLFEHPDVASLATLIQTEDKTESSLPAISRVSRDQPLPLSYAQQRLWFIDQLEGGGTQYNMPMAYRLTGAINRTAFECAINTIIERHEVLRTNFVEQSGQTHQLIRESFELPLSYRDLSGMNEADRQREAQTLILTDNRKAFDLAADVLLRVQLIKLDEQTHLLLSNMHHIASDGWSMGVFFRELSALYNAYRQDGVNPLPELPVQYADYAHWQREWLQGEVLRQQLDYWKARLADCPPVHNLPLDHPRPAQQSFNGRVYRQRLDARLSASLENLCQEYDVTLFMLLQTVFALLMGRYSNERDVVIGTPIAGRTHTDSEPLIGFFVNMLALRTRFDDNDSFVQLLARNKQSILDAFSHQHIPFEVLVEQLQPERSMQHTPLFQISFALYNNERGALDLDGLEQESLESGQGIIKFDLELFAGKSGEEMLLAWNYNTDLFESATIEQLASSYAVLLEGVLEQSQCGIEQLPLMRPPQRQQLLEDDSCRDAWQAANERQQLSSIVERFAIQVVQQANQVALSVDGEDLDYQTLNKKANRLAHYLRSLGVGVETLVGVCLPPSVSGVVARLAILKAGGAYAPLSDLSLPQQQEALTSLNIDLVVGTHELPASLAARVVVLDAADTARQLSTCSTQNPVPSRHTGHHLACALYAPDEKRAIEIEHMSLLDVLDDPAYPAIKAGHVTVVAGAHAHDQDSFLLWQSLCNGGQYIYCDSLANDCSRVKVLSLSDEVLSSVAAQTPAALSGIPHVMVASPVDGESLNMILAQGAPGEVLCVTGPEGANGYARWQRIEQINRRGIYPIALSKRLARTQDYTSMYLLDRHLQPVPVGAVGEVYHGGMRLNIDAQEVIASPFHKGEQLRKTSDWGRWVNTGAGVHLERIERIEGAVLIRGKRVSPTAVREQLKNQEQVADAWVTSRIDDCGQRRLVAYVAMTASDSDPASRLRNLQSSLQDILSAYELPSIYVLIDVLPLTASGDVDEEQLPDALAQGIEIDTYVAPRNVEEETLCAIWQSLLGVERIGIEDDFFLLGGHSLLATRLISRIRQDMSVELPLRVLFECPNIRQLAQALESHRATAVAPTIGKAPAIELDDDSLEGEVF